MSWQEEGACWDSDSTLFFPIRTEMTAKEYDETVEKAQAICKGCPVSTPCAEAGKEMEFGIWGGEVK